MEPININTTHLVTTHLVTTHKEPTFCYLVMGGTTMFGLY